MKKTNDKKQAIKKNKREMLIILGIGVAMLVVGTILLFNEIGIGAILLYLGIGFIPFSLYLGLSTRISIGRSFCSKCYAKYDYNRDIGWRVRSTSSSGNQKTASVEIETLCRTCGNRNVLYKDIVVARYNQSNHTWNEYSVESRVSNLFIK